MTKDGIKLLVDAGGEYLEMVVRWLPSIVDMKLLPSKWLQSTHGGHYTTEHLERLRFESALKVLRRLSAQKVYSRTLFHLQFSLESTINFYCFQ